VPFGEKGRIIAVIVGLWISTEVGPQN
jgi:hypothetical protein